MKDIKILVKIPIFKTHCFNEITCTDSFILLFDVAFSKIWGHIAIFSVVIGVLVSLRWTAILTDMFCLPSILNFNPETTPVLGLAA